MATLAFKLSRKACIYHCCTYHIIRLFEFHGSLFFAFFLQTMYSWISWIIPVLFFWKIVIPFLLIVFRYTLGRKWYSKRNHLRKAGEWAIVTGATAGIGKAYAEELASDGLNVMIISRSQQKLDEFAKELQEKYNVQVKTVQADFTQVSEVDQLPSIACLVNNVGMVNVNPLSFPFADEMSLRDIERFVSCNCISMASMIHIVLPRLVEQNSGAAVINLSSFSGCNPLPYLTLYSGTKAFDRHLSNSLAVELNDRNVIVQTVCPMYVATSMVGRRRGFFVLDPREYVRSALNQLGVETLTYGHWIHALQIFYFSFLPQSLIILSNLYLQNVFVLYEQTNCPVLLMSLQKGTFIDVLS
ncbi:unnamed protein product [Echinostoma caproni]|uniref:Inactive hydroxysteroid dehydrogenase-like protein 1 n=1 Tax=Echinostoma caproni TaxID=27848 RepID=A0A183BEC1_9TREM|nr:unnamed protein product [Echinostoma caproni]